MSLYIPGTTSYAGYYSGSLGAASGHPLTIACWSYRTDISSTYRSLVHYGADLSEDHSVAVRGSATGQAVAIADDGPSGLFVTTTDTALDSAWHHHAAVFASTSSRTPYLDGVAGTTNTSALGSFNAFDNLRIGRALDNTKGWLGYIGHVAIWKSALSGAQIASLAGGANPQTIDASNLVAYYPFTNASDVGEDIIGGYDLTLNGSAAYNSENPTVNAYSAAKRIVPVNFIRSQSATASGS